MEWRFTADAFLNILREGGEAVELLKDTQIALGHIDFLEAEEILIVLVETADNQFNRVIGLGDAVIANGIDQFRLVALDEIEDAVGFRVGLADSESQDQDLSVALLSYLGAIGIEDGVDLLLELQSSGMFLGIIGP